MEPYRILVVDDEESSRIGLCELASGWGYECHAASDGPQALERIRESPPHIVVSDLMMPGMTGLELMSAVHEEHPHVVFILLTGHGTIENAIQAMHEGAHDYLTKPIDLTRLRVVLEKAVERVRDREELHRLTRDLAERGKFGRLVGGSPGMQDVYRLIQQAAPTRVSVLITGESGTGKEVVARTLHEMSPRHAKPFVAVNCASIPHSLLESEILGHERGAFTGATATRPGCFELAHGGTLLLDEIGEMPPELQAKLLRVLEERMIRRVGGTQERPVDVRVISSTNIDIDRALDDGRFRRDLFYRLNVFAIRLPPLRERPDDVVVLARHFLDEHARANDKEIRGMSPAVTEVLREYRWPGNVRELRNVIERAVVVCEGPRLEVTDLPDLAAPAAIAAVAAIAGNGSGDRSHAPVSEAPRPGGPVPLEVRPGTTVEEMERLLIQETLRRTDGNKTRAAELLGISTKTLHNKLKKYRDEGTC
jgi:DNA-binding NtrC family response regulator